MARSQNARLERFEPAVHIATLKVNQMLKLGGKLLSVKKDSVEILRLSSVATVNEYGRVSWREASNEDNINQ